MFLRLLLIGFFLSANVRAADAYHALEKSTIALDTLAALAKGHVAREQLTEAEAEASMPVRVSLKMRDLGGLRERIYKGEIISPTEMEAKYYPKKEDFERVSAWLRHEGVAVKPPDLTRLSVFAQGTPTQWARTLRTRFARVAAADGKEYTSAMDTPSIPEEFSSLVLGVHNLQPHLTPKPQPMASLPTKLPTGYAGPQTVLKWYGADTLGLDGSGQEIGIVANNAYPSDLAKFWSDTGSAQTVANVTFGLGTPYPGVEFAMDIEWAGAMAPKAKIRLYGGNTGAESWVPAVLADLPAHPGLHQISSSLGLPEGADEPDSQYFAALAAAGITYFNASGDLGLSAGGRIAVYSDASDPCVTAVGMTRLMYAEGAPPDTPNGEWGIGLSGGGTSIVWPRPSWQKGPGLPAGTMRMVPDVSAVGATDRAFYVVYGNGLQGGGAGTSLSSPIWAGLCALINQARANAGKPPLGLLGPRVYPLIGTDAFRDITENDAGPYHNPTVAGPGWDNSSGIGTPYLPKLIPALAGSVNAVVAVPSVVSQTFDQYPKLGDVVTLTVTMTSPSDSPILSYQWQVIDGPTGFWIPVANGARISGATTATLTITNVQTTDSVYTDPTRGFQRVLNYRCGVSNQYGWGYSTRLAIYFGAPPVITQQPNSQSVTVGSTARFSTAPTDVRTYQWQWYKNGVAITSATSWDFKIQSVQASDAGNYSMVISGSGGSTPSDTAVLIVTAATPPPTITTQPVSQSVTVGSTVSFSIVATNATSYQWNKGSAALGGATSSTLSLSNVQMADAGNYTCTVSNAFGSTTSSIATLGVTAVGVAPSITQQPSSQTVTMGSSATFAVTASGATSYQWRKGTASLTGATAAMLTLPAVQSTDAGNYSCLATNAYGSTASNTASLTVTSTPPPPTITTQPLSQSVTVGSTVTFAVVATGATTYQWSHDSSALNGATAATLRLTSAQTTDAGTYTCKVSNAYGSTTSSGATLTVTPAGSLSPVKLVNISTRSPVGTSDQVQIAGFIISGTAAKKVLLRASGPALTQYGVSGVLADPILTLYSGSNVMGQNDDWGSDSNVPAYTAASGAVPFAAGSKDSALAVTLQPGAYTAIVNGKDGGTGISLVEVFEADGTGSSSKLTNISTRAQALTADQVMIAGFIVSGTSPKKLLVRASGPALTQYGVGGVLADPTLTLYSGSTVIGQNDDWGTDPNVPAFTAGAGAGAFAQGSKDSAIAATLPPGPYTAIVSGQNGGTGTALIEIFEVP